MPSDYENGAKKTIDISIKAEKMTADVLKSALQEFLSGKAEKKGRMTYKQLQAKSPSKLDSIEVSDRNIGDFLKTARKYDVDFALKRDKSTEPPTYHVFFFRCQNRGFQREHFRSMSARDRARHRSVASSPVSRCTSRRRRSGTNLANRNRERKNKGEQTVIYNHFQPAPVPRARGDDIFTADFLCRYQQKGKVCKLQIDTRKLKS